MCSRYASEQANRLSTQMKTYDVPSYVHRLSLFLRGKLAINAQGVAGIQGEKGKAKQGDEDVEQAEEEEEETIDEPLRWGELSALVAGFAQSTPSLDCLYGVTSPALIADV